jgi:hypothetical protein
MRLRDFHRFAVLARAVTLVVALVLQGAWTSAMVAVPMAGPVGAEAVYATGSMPGGGCDHCAGMKMTLAAVHCVSGCAGMVAVLPASIGPHNMGSATQMAPVQRLGPGRIGPPEPHPPKRFI